MKGDKKVIDVLNETLTRELTAINQYFLHARILDDWGFKKFGKIEYDASIDEMKHADDLIKRILMIGGLPNVQKIGKVTIGQNVKEIIEADLKVENEAVPALKAGILVCEKAHDFVSRDLLLSILHSEEEHTDMLETMLDLYKKVGEQNFLQSQMDV
jgi:bacterioferritin